MKVKDDGTVKVLDFGLAKAFQPDASDPALSQSPTISLTAAATQMGMVIGTAAYMAPEQAKGKVVDKRADVWAFGAVLFEMLTGQKPFAGDDVSTTLARVIEREPNWGALPSTLLSGSGDLFASVPGEGAKATHSGHRGHAAGDGGGVRDGGQRASRTRRRASASGVAASDSRSDCGVGYRDRWCDGVEPYQSRASALGCRDPLAIHPARG